MKKYIPISICLILVSVIYSEEPIAIYGLRAIGIPENVSASLSEALEVHVVNSGKFRVMSRSDVNQVLKENAFQLSGACNTNECIVEVGQIIGVRKIITGSISKLGLSYNIVLKILDVETSEIISSKSISVKGDEGDLIKGTETCAFDLLNQNNPEVSQSDISNNNEEANKSQIQLDEQTTRVDNKLKEIERKKNISNKNKRRESVIYTTIAGVGLGALILWLVLK